MDFFASSFVSGGIMSLEGLTTLTSLKHLEKLATILEIDTFSKLSSIRDLINKLPSLRYVKSYGFSKSILISFKAVVIRTHYHNSKNRLF